MRVINSCLSNSLLKRCQSEINENNNWSSSTLKWAPVLREGICGSTLTKECSSKTTSDLLAELKSYLPQVTSIVAQYYIWQPMSGIAIHNDGGHKIGATIYLNERWHPNNGGWFVWYDEEIKEWKTILPKENLLVINDNKEDHLVTPLPAASNYAVRQTIQIWGT